VLFPANRYFLVLAAVMTLVSNGTAQQAPAVNPQPGQTATTPPANPPPAPDTEAERKRKSAEQLKKQEHQRILGIIPEFNTSNLSDAVPLTAKQKFQLAFRSAVDPFQFLSAAVDAGISQFKDDYPEYRQGVEGYSKRFGAAYADNFDGAILGNAVLPALLREDPRYFRKGTGSIASRMWYAAESTIRCRTDKGKWAPNYGNLLGNLAAGGISNLYYPASDRGVGLTFQRALTVSAEGAVGAVAYEFWPDIQRHFKHKKNPSSGN
jgi:hypothetical protein